MNNSTKKAVFGIWATIIFSAILAIIDKWSGYIGDGEFMFTLILYGIFSIIPYKISKGSDAAKYFYLVLFTISIFSMIGIGRGDMSLVSFIGNILMIPVSIYIIYELFPSVKNLLKRK